MLFLPFSADASWGVDDEAESEASQTPIKTAEYLFDISVRALMNRK